MNHHDPFVEGNPSNSRYENWRKQAQVSIEKAIREGRIEMPIAIIGDPMPQKTTDELLEELLRVL